ncbi:hypothetical protein, conserved [Babesia bigemina]|uniref:C3H1-type domain-containing protein n=1 Tax=Babesia bigemina TaxID=5866 RepID=A0A061BJQ3_BABBI|nr:hypothetical protein, conserved [Babesia bigemina]CDR71730.1 hypothetical protein, conserved [Babesia bigemina]|eukprot:XP_012770676.1 hypothetical protein, conserved [Babesia bigemina]
MTSLDHNNNLSLVPLHLPPSTSCHCPDHVPPSELDKKFDKILNLKITSNNNPTNILTNLCTGLETFLGFNSDSKGYDGTGIVYSDLDRLCDGVMGFLYGVLGAVKDDEAVKTYYNTDKMITVLDIIKKKMHNGPSEFVNAVDYVRGVLSDYHIELNERTNKINNSLSELTKKIETNKNTVDSKKSKPLVDQLSNWTTTVDGLSIDINNIMTLINNLDPDLSDKLRSEINLVAGAVTTMAESTKDGRFQTHMAYVDKAMEEEENRMREKVEEQSKRTQKTLGDQFTNVFNDVGTLRQKKKERFDIINEMIKKAREFMDNYDKTYMNVIDEKFRAIEVSLNDVNKSHQVGGSNLSSRLKNDVNAIRGALLQIGDEMEKQVTGLENWIGSVTKLIDHAKKHQIDKVTNKDVAAKYVVNVTNMTLNMKEWQDVLNKYITNVREVITTEVREVQRKIGTLYKVIESGRADGTATQKSLCEIIETMQGKVADIYGKRRYEGLRDIPENVMSYADKFTKDNFHTKVLDGWLRDILKTDGVVKQRLREWIKENKGTGKLSGTVVHGKISEDEVNAFVDGTKKTLHEPIICQVMKVLQQQVIQKATENFAKVHDGVAENFKSVKNVCEQFAKQFESTVDDKVDPIVTAIESSDGLNVSSSGFSKTDLKRAVERILNKLVTRAKHVAEEIAVCLDRYKMGNVDDAVTKTDKLLKNLYKAAGSEKYAQNVDAAIDAITDKVDGINIDLTISKLREWSEGIEANIHRLLSEYSKTGEFMHRYLYDLKTEFLDTQLAKIHYNLYALKNEEFSHTQGRIQSAIKTVIAIVENLETVPSDVREKRRKADELMKKLKIDVESIVIGIDLAIITADQTLTKTINDFVEELVKCEKMCKQAVDDLRNNMLNQIKASFSIVTSSVQQLFATERQADLRALEMLVESQSIIIDGLISNAMRTGVIGSMKTLSGVPAGHKGDVTEEHNLLMQLRKKMEEDGEKVAELVPYVRAYLRPIIVYNKDEIERLIASHPSPSTDYPSQLKAIFDKLVELLNHLEKDKLYNYDHNFVDLLASLNSLVDSLSPSFTSPCPLLAPLKSGLSNFAAQLGHAYVNRYSGKQFNGGLIVTKTITDDTKQPPNSPKTIEELTPEGRNCAKVCLTIVEMVKGELDVLGEKCKLDWHSKQIDRISVLGSFLAKCGYVVSDRDKQDGELQRSDKMMGSHIHAKIRHALTNVENIKTHLLKCKSNEDEKTGRKKKSDKFHVLDVLGCLHHHLETYYTVGHMATFTAKRNPCSVYEMLVWCAGLNYSLIYDTFLREGFTGLLQKPERKTVQTGEDLGFEIEFDDMKSYYLDAYPGVIKYDHISAAVNHICATSHDVLTRIIGHGDEYTTYGVDFCNNSLKFRYPTSAEECLDMFLDILRRLFPPLKYLETQCSTAAREYGWAGCHYGKDVQTTNWPCNEHSSSKATCQPNDQPKCEPNCQPKSPLMSYLNDCLPGHLPHVLSDIGCKAKCSTCPRSTPGMPCLTPLGFRGFSGTKRAGRDISDVLGKFFDNGKLNVLFSLQAKTPSTLPEHFGFALSFVKGWSDVTDTRNHSIKQSIEASITDRSIKLYEPPSTLTDKLRDAYGSTHIPYPNKQHLPAYADLSSLAVAKPCTVKDVNCAPYLSSLCIDTYHHLAKKQSNTYLSWAIYLPWTFWDLLNNLYNAFCSINCQDWGCRGCLRGDKCKKGGHGVVDTEKPNNKCQCTSIVDCKGVAPTLYQYGFVFGEASTLNDKASPKNCSDFCSQLKNVLKSKYFEKLFEECDNFLWIIRQPFIWTTVALWLLSFLYLLHIMVIRLDLLHIKSHLHSPSSHRIAAQSLLAAARVNKLNRVFYLQP